MKKVVLREDEMPTIWYNVVPDIPNALQLPLDPETMEPVGPEKLSAVFPMSLLEQEMSQDMAFLIWQLMITTLMVNCMILPFLRKQLIFRSPPCQRLAEKLQGND